MSDVVFILGAGASKEAGAPLMYDFLARAQGLFREDKCEEYREDFERVFRAIAELQRVHSKSELDLDNLESVFAAFEMAQLLGQLPGTDESEIPRVVTSMRRVITKTLEETMLFRFSRDQLLEHVAYSQLAGLLGHLEVRRISASMLTFNYDLGLDFALHRSGRAFYVRSLRW